MSPEQLFGEIINSPFLGATVEKSNLYGMQKTGISHNIFKDRVYVFFGVLLLSGYNKVHNFDMYWIPTKAIENLMVKKLSLMTDSRR